MRAILLSAMTNARLDHYVYTRQSLERARSLLAKGGVVSLSFEAAKPYIADRMAHLLRDVFGQEPLVFRVPRSRSGWGGVMFVAGDLAAVRASLAERPTLAATISRWQREMPIHLSYTTPITTDDWPYLYLDAPRVPLLYVFLAGLLVLLLVIDYLRGRTPPLWKRWGRSHTHFFFLGAAFLLLEVHNLSKAGVVLGNTWWVSALIITAVLAMVLLANLVAAFYPELPVIGLFVLLCASCVAVYAVDLARFASYPFFVRALAVGGLTCLPMFFGGIVFIRSFAQVESKNEALGANLLGALAGALLEPVTFVTGIRSLALLVAGFYVLALLTRPKPERTAKSSTPARAPGLTVAKS